MEKYEQYYNKGNDCDCCKNQYLCGKYGDAVGCKCLDVGAECEFVEQAETEKCARIILKNTTTNIYLKLGKGKTY